MSENAQKDTEVTAQENKKAPSKKEKKENETVSTLKKTIAKVKTTRKKG